MFSICFCHQDNKFSQISKLSKSHTKKKCFKWKSQFPICLIFCNVSNIFPRWWMKNTWPHIFYEKPNQKRKKKSTTTKAKQNTDQRKKKNQKKKLKNICNNYRIIRFGKIPNQIFCFNLFSALSLLDNEDGHSWVLRKFRISQLCKVQTNWQKKNYLFGQKKWPKRKSPPGSLWGVILRIFSS